jgi:hypothetical protein
MLARYITSELAVGNNAHTSNAISVQGGATSAGLPRLLAIRLVYSTPTLALAFFLQRLQSTSTQMTHEVPSLVLEIHNLYHLKLILNEKEEKVAVLA